MDIDNIINSPLEDLKKIAANLSTPPHILTELSKNDDSTIRYLVASNPNTPTETLKYLSKEFPDTILANPVIELLKLENPHGYFGRLSLACDPNTAPETLATLAKLISNKIEDAKICLAVVKNPNTPVNAQVNLFVDIINWQVANIDNCHGNIEIHFLLSDIGREIINNPRATESCVKEFLDSSDEIEHRFRFFLYHCTEISKLSFDTIEKLSRHKNIYGGLLIDLPVVQKSSTILDNIARNTFTDESVLNKILDNSITSAATLEFIAAHDSPDVRNLVINHPNVSRKALDIVSFIEGKPGTSIELLKELVENPRFYIPEALCMYSDTPSEILEKAVDKIFNRSLKTNLTILEDIITHPNISAKILLKILEQLNKMFIVKNGKVSSEAKNLIIHRVKEKMARLPK